MRDAIGAAATDFVLIYWGYIYPGKGVETLLQAFRLVCRREKNVRPVGASIEVPLDVRILSATHKNLGKLVEDGRFRHDLYYRINVIELPVPPLRERVDDIVAIARSVLERISAELGEPVPPLSGNAIASLKLYPFPGNVRELENILERAVALCETAEIGTADLRLPRLVNVGASATSNTAPLISDYRQTGSSALPEALEQIERESIQKALEACRYNKTKTAAQLGITFRALRYKLKKLGIE